ncbi:Hypothetical protein CAP_8709 [Chondromyces apiculatus DSM 436]|uniref:Uncharacterized protein n=2 Tax=Chondromyces apiculatus TaxID=51 RepID=A0A017TG90_9BACT|nr:Hypothetical protein CAP_8709 [Chondromyces apiculatus DSM 436]
MDASAAYEEHLAAAQAVENPMTYRLSADLALANLQLAKKYVVEKRAQILAHFPLLDITQFDSLGRLALGLKFAALQAEEGPSDREIDQVLVEARELRRKLLSTVAALATAGLVPKEVHAKIAQGRGPRDAAEDCVALAQVFRQAGSTLDGKHAVTEDEVDRTSLVGSWLLEHLRPAGAKRLKGPKPEAVRTRDQMATLLTTRYAKLQAVAHYFEGDGWEEKVPLLMTRMAPPRQDEADPATPSPNGGGGGGGSQPAPLPPSGPKPPVQVAPPAASAS